MSQIPNKLREAVEKVSGPKKARPVKLRTFLSWFGARRRGSQVESDIRAALTKVNLATEPDFMAANIADRIRLVPAGTVGTSGEQGPDNQPSSPKQQEAKPADVPSTPASPPDPTPKLGTIFAGGPPVSVKRDDSIRHAITLMLKHDYSQLPVMASSRQVEGLISWKSIGKEVNVASKRCERVSDCLDHDVEILRWDKPLWEAIRTIADKDVVLIKDRTNEIVGIVTNYDLASQYHALNEPFFLLGEIENNLRQLARLANFPLKTLEASKDPKDTTRTITGVDKLTFGELVRMLDDPANWEKIPLKLSRKAFVIDLKKIVIIRNEVMHFSPDPLDRESLGTLRQSAKMFRSFRLFEGAISSGDQSSLLSSSFSP